MSDLRGQTDDGAEFYTEDVSRAYRLAAREEPGPEVDAAIHAAAVRAAGSPSRFHRRRRGAWWGVPIAVATTIVIGLSVAFLASDRPDPVSQSNESQRSLPAPSAAPASTEVPAADAARQTPQPPAGEAGGQPPVAAAAREARPTRERTTRDQAVPRREHYASRPPAPASGPGSGGCSASCAECGGDRGAATTRRAGSGEIDAENSTRSALDRGERAAVTGGVAAAYPRAQEQGRSARRRTRACERSGGAIRITRCRQTFRCPHRSVS